MALSENIVRDFIPVHQLESIGKTTPITVGGKQLISDISSDDLFMVSQLCAESTSESDAVMVSKKLSYFDLQEKISVDHDIQKIKDDVVNLSDEMLFISSEVSSNYNTLINTISAVSNYLSTDYVEKIDNLSTEIDVKLNTKIDKYGRKDYNITQGCIVRSFALSDGQLLNNTVVVDHVSSWYNVEGIQPAAGTILGDVVSSETKYVNAANIDKIEYAVHEDSYVTIKADILENPNDVTDDQLELHLVNISSYNGQSTTFNAILGVFFNNGGYSGTDYYNEYFTGYPIKCKTYDRNITSTKLVLKYRNDKKFNFDSTKQPSKVVFTEYRLHSTLAETELKNYVPKNQVGADYSRGLGLYKTVINSNGLVIETSNVPKDDLCSIIGCASNTGYGLVKTSNVNTSPKYGLKVDSKDGSAYVNIPQASNTIYGTVILNNTQTTNANPQYYSVIRRSGATGGACVSISSATSVDYGTVKTGTRDYDTGTDNFNVIGYSKAKQDQLHDLRLDENGKACIVLHKASQDTFGTVKLGSSRNPGELYMDVNGVAKVSLQQQSVDFLVEQILKLRADITNLKTVTDDHESRISALENP